MKTFRVLIAVLMTSVFLISCGARSSEVTFFLVAPKAAGSVKKFGCEDFLVTVKQKVEGDYTAKSALTTLFATDVPSDYGPGFFTASAIKDHAVQLEDVFEPEDPAESGGEIRVYLKMNPLVGLTGVCDTPRVKEQVETTVGVYAEQKKLPYFILLDNSLEKWKCLGDESGNCPAKK